MNSEQKHKYKNPFVLPVFGIAFLIIFTMTISYGYYTVNSTKAANTANGNFTMPRKCVLTTVNSSASTTVNKTYLRYDDPISANGEYGIGSTTSAYIRLNGGTGCACSYTLRLYSEGNNYSATNYQQTQEFIYRVEGSSNGSMPNFVNGENVSPFMWVYTPIGYTGGVLPAVGAGYIKVMTSGTQVQHTWTYNQSFFNLPDYNQIVHQGKTYKYSLRFIVDRCTFDKPLPDAYQEVEYIQNSGTQYIDTGYVYSETTKEIEIEINATPTTTSGRYCLMANYSGAGSMSFEIYSNQGRFYTQTGHDIKLGTYSTSKVNTFLFYYMAGPEDYHININGVSTAVDGKGAGSGYGTGGAQTLLLFVDQAKRFSTFNKPLKMYGVKIKENGTLVRNMIPCYRKSDNKAGMYDTVNNVFYTDPGGNNFTVGPNIVY